MSTSPCSDLVLDLSESPGLADQPPTFTVACHGRLVGDTFPDLTDTVKPLIERDRRVLVDCGDLSRIDSSGLGALVGLKVTSLKRNSGTFQLINLPAFAEDLLRLTRTTDFLTQP